MVGDKAVYVREQEVDARRGAPVAHEAVLDVDTSEGAGLTGLGIRVIGAHERVAPEVDLTDGEVVGAAPVTLDAGELVGGHGARARMPGRAKNRVRHAMLLCQMGYAAEQYR